MNLSKFPRRRYTPGPTPLEKLPRLTSVLDGPDIYMKRDDLLGLAAGGNKTRKLEFLVADALAQGADTLITVGAVQSNHCRLTLAAAAKEGMRCRLVLEERVPGSYKQDASGNNFLFQLLGVEGVKVVSAGADLAAAMEEVAEDVAREGRKAYVMPGGGSNAIGATGYAACAEEILAQSFEQSVAFDCIVTPSGSAGTHAGLVVGLIGNNANIPLIGINVSRGKQEQEAKVHDLAQATAVRLGVKGGIPRESVQCFDEYFGPGYSLPNAGMEEAVKLVARTESVLLDPVYTGKAMFGLIDLIRKGYFRKGQNVLFVHTGGSPALYAYQQYFHFGSTAQGA